jgi:hypothetical protein
MFELFGLRQSEFSKPQHVGIPPWRECERHGTVAGDRRRASLCANARMSRMKARLHGIPGSHNTANAEAMPAVTIVRDAPASAPPSATAVLDTEGLGAAGAAVAARRERWAKTSVAERIGLPERVYRLSGTARPTLAFASR